MGGRPLTWVDSSFFGVGAALTALVLVGLWSHARRRRLLAEFLGGRAAMRRYSRSDLNRYGVRRALLLAVAGAALTVAMAEPRWLEAPPPQPPPVKRVMIAIDVSASMQAEDAVPTRLGAAAEAARQVLDSLAGHEVGLLLYAGTTYPLAPPTLDHDAIRFLLSGVTPRVASAQDPGTLLSVAIRESITMLDRSFTDPADPVREADDADATPPGAPGAASLPGVAEIATPDAIPARPGEHIVVLIGDGDVGESDEDVLAAVAEAREAGVSLHTIAVGTTAGAGMIMPSGTYQLGGRVVDASGRPGASRLRETLLREVAGGGGGLYAQAEVPSQVVAVQTALADLGPAPEPTVDLTAPAWTRYDVPFVLGSVALALVVLESLLGLGLAKVRVPRAARAPFAPPSVTRRPGRRAREAA